MHDDNNNIEDYVSDKFEVDKKSKRIMKSLAARKHRKEVKEIIEAHSLKEQKDYEQLVNKHNNLIKSKK